MLKLPGTNGLGLSEKEFSQQIVELAIWLGWLHYRIPDSRRTPPGLAYHSAGNGSEGALPRPGGIHSFLEHAPS
jgi:hypothetical protein